MLGSVAVRCNEVPWGTLARPSRPAYHLAMRTLPSFAFALLLGVTAGQRAPVLPAGHVPPAPAISAERLARIDKVLQQYVDENKVGGVVGLVLQDGKPVYERAVGWADKEAGTKMAPDTIFRIASQTKALTSVAILSLMEEGKISLTDPVSRYIPSFANSKVAVRKDTGVDDRARQASDQHPRSADAHRRDFLRHRCAVASQYEAKGLGPAAGYGWFTADKDEPICTTMERLGTLPFVAQPGEAWVYGYNTDILGCVVEKVSGTPLDEFIRTRITGPLGMKDTQFFLPPAQRARLAAVYSSGSDGTIMRAPDGARGQGAYVDGPRKSFAGGAGPAVDGARLRALPRNDPPRRRDRRRAHPVAAHRRADDHEPGRHAAFADRPGLRPRLRDHRSLRRQRHGLGGIVRVGRRLQLHLPRRSGRAPRDRLHGADAAQYDRSGPQVSDARLSGTGTVAMRRPVLCFVSCWRRRADGGAGARAKAPSGAATCSKAAG